MSKRASATLRALSAVCIAAGCVAAARPAAAAAQSPAAGSEVTAIRNVRVFDGRRVVAGATVVIRDGLIAAVGTNVPVPGGARVVDGGAAGTSHALEVSGEIEGSLPFAWGGAMFFPSTPPMTPTNLSASKGIRFHARGDGKTYRVLLFWRGGGQVPSTRTFTAGPEWQELSFPWSDFRGSDGSDVMGIAIVGGPAAGPYRLLIDQVGLY